MSARKSTLIIIISTSLLFISVNFAQASYAVGDTVTNFTLNDVHGNPIDHAISGNVLGRTGQAGKGCIEISHVNDIANGLSPFDHAGPRSKRWNANSALEKVTLATTVHETEHSELRRRAMDHRPVVGHGHHERVFCDAQRSEFFH